MGMTIGEYKCYTCIHAWTDECPLQKCWEHDYKYYEKQAEEKEKIKEEFSKANESKYVSTDSMVDNEHDFGNENDDDI